MKKLEDKILLRENKYNFSLNDFISIGYTPKKERTFYLLNKLVGNHIEVKPNAIKAIGYLLANLIYDKQCFNTFLLANYIKGLVNDEELINTELDKFIIPDMNTFIFGLSESATAIGMSVACAIKDSYYVSTSRDKEIKRDYCCEFEENHFSISNHRCYLKDTSKLNVAEHIIIVEDEITTGNTLINMIESIVKISKTKNYTIVSLLNFSDNTFSDKIKCLEDKYNLSIDVRSIAYGSLDYIALNNPVDEKILIADNDDDITVTDFPINLNIFDKTFYQLNDGNITTVSSQSGLFGVSFKDIRDIEIKAKEVANKLDCSNKKILVIGHGENMYLPSRIAYYLSNDCLFKSTTKSFILINNNSDYIIKQRSKFNANNNTYYLYNRKAIEKEYDQVYFIVDFDLNLKLTNNTIVVKI